MALTQLPCGTYILTEGIIKVEMLPRDEQEAYFYDGGTYLEITYITGISMTVKVLSETYLPPFDPSLTKDLDFLIKEIENAKPLN